MPASHTKGDSQGKAEKNEGGCGWNLSIGLVYMRYHEENRNISVGITKELTFTKSYPNTNTNV